MYNPALIITILIPVLAYGVYRLNIRHEQITLFLGVISCWACFFMAFMPAEIFYVLHVTKWLSYYCLFGGINILFFSLVLGPRETSKIVAYSMISVFIASEFYELPVFIYGNLGFTFYARWVGQISDHIHRLYVLASIVLLSKMGKFQFKRLSLILICTGLLFTFTVLNPAVITFLKYGSAAIMSRIWILFLTMLILVDSVEKP